MRRFVALLLALLLPLQFTWGAAASYCGHETAGARNATAAAASPHFGHHQHVHLAEDGKPASAKPAVDNDCSACHATPPAIASPAAAAVDASVSRGRGILPPVARLRSAPARAPDRPQWLRLA